VEGRARSQRVWCKRRDHAIHCPDTKSAEQIRVIGEAAMDCIASQPGREGSPYLFPADIGEGHFISVVRMLDRVCPKAKRAGVSAHVLRHTFASVAGDLGLPALAAAVAQDSGEMARRRGEGRPERGSGRGCRCVGRSVNAGGMSRIECRWRPVWQAPAVQEGNFAHYQIRPSEFASWRKIGEATERSSETIIYLARQRHVGLIGSVRWGLNCLKIGPGIGAQETSTRPRRQIDRIGIEIS
jgi:hypothetical protein